MFTINFPLDNSPLSTHTRTHAHNSRKEIVYCSNRSSTQTCQHLDAGSVYGLSNGLLDSPWMKVIEGKKHFSDIVANISADVSNEKLTEQLFTLLSDDRW